MFGTFKGPACLGTPMTARDGIALLVVVLLVAAGVSFALAAWAPWGMSSMMDPWHPVWSGGLVVMAALLLVPLGLLVVAIAVLLRGSEPRPGS